MDIFYASHFGHTERIAQALARAIGQSGVAAQSRNLVVDYPSDAELRTLDPCVLISAIRYGGHLAEARRLARQLAPLTPLKPVVLLSVSLSARKPDKTTPSGNLYLRKWIARSGMRPRLAAAIAGKLEYPRYNVFDRTMIRLIMTITGGPTDGTSVIDYTDWTRIAELAAQIVEAIAPAREEPADPPGVRDSTG